MPGPRGGGRGRGNGRGQLAGPQRDLFTLTRAEVGLDQLYSYQQVDKPPPLYPHRSVPKRRAPVEAAAEERMIEWAEELASAARASPYFLGDATAPDRPLTRAGAAAGVKRLVAHLGDVLRSDLFPKELVAPDRAPSAAKRARAAPPRKRHNSVGDDLDELAAKEKEEGTAGASASLPAPGGSGDGVAPPRRRRGGVEDEEEAGLDDEDLGDEEEEDFNDYAQVHDEDDGDDDGEEEYGGGGGREAEY